MQASGGENGRPLARTSPNREVKRGLAYYVDDGFEAKCPKLGAQKQMAGAGRYADGIGWAIELDRLLLALEH